MKYISIFNERLLIVRSQEELDEEITDFSQGCVIAVFNDGKITIKTELSDLTEDLLTTCQLTLDNISKVDAIFECINESRDIIQIGINNSIMFTEDDRTLQYLFKAGARTTKMRLLDKLPLEKGEIFRGYPYSEQSRQLIQDIIFVRGGGQEEGYLSFGNSNSYITRKTKIPFTGRPTRIFLETIYGMKHELFD